MTNYRISPERLQEFNSLELLAKQIVEGFITGLHKSPFHGFSVEFAEHRLYNSGESTKHIDWKLFGRTDKLFVKRYEEETNLRCQLIIDESSSMFFPIHKNTTIDNPNKISFAIYCAAAIMQLMKKQRDAVGLSFFSNQIEVHTPTKSASVHHALLYHELEKRLNPIYNSSLKTTSVSDALHQLSERIHKRSLVIIFSDMFQDAADKNNLFNALQHLVFNKHEVLLFHVTDKKQEAYFDFPNTPHKFIDMENGQEIKITPQEIKQKYTQQYDAYIKELALKCAQYRIEFIETDINKGFTDVLLTYLLKRQKLY